MAGEFKSVVKDFLMYLTVERNLSPQTIKAYAHDLKNFQAFLQRQFDCLPSIGKITTEILRTYFAELHLDRSYKGISLARKVSSLRSFFRFALERNYIKTNPIAPVRNPKLPKRLPIYLTREELKKLLMAPGNKTWLELRDRTILVLLAMTGIRLQELGNLDIEHVDLQNQTMRVYGKGRKERLLPLNSVVTMVLADYLKLRPVVPDKALIINHRGKRLIGRTIEKIVRRYAIVAGLPAKKVSPHKLRHTFATLLHQNEVDLLEIQLLLGHSSITSTQIYTHTDPHQLRQAVNKLQI
ncbi:MAG: tyrosine recombinase XerC [Candidatus Sumerlaeia bacterium]|nr:tyrosine recombinase XerC [Candidatus Sumerlaeia bacterium]